MECRHYYYYYFTLLSFMLKCPHEKRLLPVGLHMIQYILLQHQTRQSLNPEMNIFCYSSAISQTFRWISFSALLKKKVTTDLKETLCSYTKVIPKRQTLLRRIVIIYNTKPFPCFSFFISLYVCIIRISSECM